MSEREDIIAQLGSTTVEINGRRDLARDLTSHAVISTDVNGLRAAQERKRLFEERKAKIEKVDKLENEVNELRGEIGQVKGMLVEILNTLRTKEG